MALSLSMDDPPTPDRGVRCTNSGYTVPTPQGAQCHSTTGMAGRHVFGMVGGMAHLKTLLKRVLEVMHASPDQENRSTDGSVDQLSVRGSRQENLNNWLNKQLMTESRPYEQELEVRRTAAARFVQHSETAKRMAGEACDAITSRVSTAGNVQLRLSGSMMFEQ